MSMEFIRRSYGVPARRGGRVVYYGESEPVGGRIRSARGGYLRITLDSGRTGLFHPTWEMMYLRANSEK